jgi:hypothetical protein
MTLRRLVWFVIIVALAVVPALGYAGDHVGSSIDGKPHHPRVERPSHQTWRTPTTTLTTVTAVQDGPAGVRLAESDTTLVVPLLVRTRFVPPRG